MTAPPIIRLRTNTVLWFAIAVFAYYYKAFLCGLLGNGLGLEFFCFTWIHGISPNHWIDILIYCPLVWFALHQVNADVFGDIPIDAKGLRKNRGLHLVGEIAIALVIYGMGIHIANVIEIYSRERVGLAEGDLYDLIYLLDEHISHYLQNVPLFFVIGWFVINDRRGRTGHRVISVFLGVGHGVERSFGIIEGSIWFLGLPTVAWFAFAAWLRWRKVGATAANEFFVRYAAAFCIALPVSQLAYYLRFGSFDQPSGLSDGDVAHIALGAFVLTMLGTLTLVSADRWWRGRRLEPA
jgi:hypothetical protein